MPPKYYIAIYIKVMCLYKFFFLYSATGLVFLVTTSDTVFWYLLIISILLMQMHSKFENVKTT